MIQKSNVRAGKCWKYPSQLPEIILLIQPAEWDIFSRTPIIIDYGRLLGTLLYLNRFSADRISGNSTESQQVYFLQCTYCQTCHKCQLHCRQDFHISLKQLKFSQVDISKLDYWNHIGNSLFNF